MTAEQFCNWLSGYLDIAAPLKKSTLIGVKDGQEVWSDFDKAILLEK
jgi:hypothetical protein